MCSEAIFLSLPIFSTFFHSCGRECCPLHHLGSGDRRFSVSTPKTAQTKTSETDSHGYEFRLYARSPALQPPTQTP
jgi:hypothetical protein